MSTDIDWRRELDSSFGTGQDIPVGHYVATGHRAVRRRRAGAAVASLAAAAVVVGAGWGLGGGSAPSSDAPVATDPTASGTPRAEDAADSRPWREGEPPARVMPDGVDLRPGATVNERRDDLFPDKDTESVALDVTWQGERWWMTLEWDGDGGGAMSSARPSDGLFDSFDAFVRDSVAGGGMTSQPTTPRDAYFAGLVTWDGDEVVTWPGVEVVRRVEDPSASSGDSLGLVLREGDETTWMLITLDGSTGGAASTKDTETGAATFEEWLAQQVALVDGTPHDEPVELAPDGSVVATSSDVTVLDQQADPDLRAYGTEADGATSAVALVERDGQRWFAFLLDDSVTTVAASKAPGVRTLDDFVAFMADRADEGGMR